MRLLLDECIPRSLKAHLNEHTCLTVQQAGWAGKRNGELLSLAEEHFDVFVTLDKGIGYQQNLTGRKIAVLILRARTNRIADLLLLVPACRGVLSSIRHGEMRLVVQDNG